jgi:hypothetical protein
MWDILLFEIGATVLLRCRVPPYPCLAGRREVAMEIKEILHLIVKYGHLLLALLTYFSSRKKDTSEKDVKGKKKTRKY